MPAMAHNRRSIGNIQILRALAALLVVAAHCIDTTIALAGPGSTPGGILDDFGAAGVDLFFVISGFVIAHTAFVGVRREAGQFARQRLHRVVPLYFIMSALAASGSPIYVDELVATLLFWPALHPYMLATPMMFVGWTLCFEMLFYAAATLALLRPGRTMVGVLLAGYVLCWALGTVTGLSAFRFLGNPLIVEFLFGVLIANIAGRVPASWGRIALLAGLAWFAATLALGQVGAGFDSPDVLLRPLIWGVPSALLVLGAVVMADWRPAVIMAPLLTLGTASYALYLAHILALRLLERGWEALHLPAPALLVFGLAMAVSILAGLLVHYLVERPLLAGTSRWRSRAAETVS
jgi:exopolysaccharide production protein ExoZ